MLNKIKKVFILKKYINDDYDLARFIDKNTSIEPDKQSFKLSIVYALSGIIWVILSAILLSYFADNKTIILIELVKGCIYIFSTSVAVFFILRKHITYTQQIMDRLFYSYKQLNTAHDEFIARSHSDTSQLMSLENKFRNEKNFLHNVLDTAPIIIIIWDIDGRVIKFNKYAEKATGFNKEEMIGNKWMDMLIPTENILNSENLITKIQKGETMSNLESCLLCKNDDVIDVLWKNSIMYSEVTNSNVIISMGIDITERKLAEKKIYKLAFFDSLSGLPNRMLFETKLNEQISEAKQKDKKLALLYFDIDNFKNINDSLGHEYGDQLLIYITRKLCHIIKEPNTIARISGDQFAVVLYDIKNINDIIPKANAIISMGSKPWVVNEHEFNMSLSMGIAIYPDHGQDIHTLIKCADTAMFSAKENGKGKYHFFADHMQENTIKYLQMEKSLRHAVDNNEFLLYYQPQVDLKTGKIIGLEALIRWLHPEKGIIPPLEFIPFAEENGLISKIGEWLLKEALMQRDEWKRLGYAPVTISINLSGKQFGYGGIENIINIYNDIEDHFSNMQFEITETAVMSDLNASVFILTKLKEMGASIALDDFGKGYSSLNYLKKLPIDVLKMDKTFTQSIVPGSKEESIARAIIQMAHEMNLTVIAEGIETKEQLEILNRYNCDAGQGYLFSKPVPAQNVSVLLRQDKLF